MTQLAMVSAVKTPSTVMRLWFSSMKECNVSLSGGFFGTSGCFSSEDIGLITCEHEYSSTLDGSQACADCETISRDLKIQEECSC